MPRPKLGENPLNEYAETARSPVMRQLLRVALARGFNVTLLASQLDCDRKTLYAYLTTESPRSSTVKRFVTALGRGPRVARALMNELTESDVRYLRGSLEVTIEGYADRFADVGAAKQCAAEVWRLPADIQCAALASYLIAFEGFGDEPPLIAFTSAIRASGYDVGSAMNITVSLREAAISFAWLADAAALSGQQKEQVWSLIASAVGGADHPGLIEPRYKQLYKRARFAVGGQIE
jgi:hypothetical protein